MIGLTALRITGLTRRQSLSPQKPFVPQRATQTNDMLWKTSSGAASGRWAAKNISSMMAVR